MAPIAAPFAEQIHSFLVGGGSDLDRQIVEHWLIDRPDAAETIDGLAISDTFVEVLRSAAGESSYDDEFASLIRKVLEHDPAVQVDTAAGLLASNYDTIGSAPPGVAFLAPPLEAGEIGRLGEYRVLRLLGEGGMGIVFEAEDVQLRRHVALKVMKPDIALRSDARQRFLREARAAAGIDSDYVVTIHHVGTDNGVPYLAMPLLRGSSLEGRLADGQPLTVAEVLRIGQQIAAGLAAAHAHGLIHRDIKPANLWLDPDQGGRIKILDFGLARIEQDDTGLTGSGVLLGTPAYMAPEQAHGEPVDFRADLFSLGVVLYRMSTGLFPFQGRTILAVLASLMADDPIPPKAVNPQVPKALSELILRLLAKSTDSRPACATEVREALESIAQTDFHNKTATRPTRPRSRRAMVAAGLAGSFVLAAILFVLQLPQGNLVVDVSADGIEIQARGAQLQVVDRIGNRRYRIQPNQPSEPLKAGDYRIVVIDDDGEITSLAEFNLKRDGRVVARVRMEAPMPADVAVAPADADVRSADRRAAEYVLAIGGDVKINADTVRIKTLADLPQTPFELTGVRFGDDAKLTAKGLSCFLSCENLRDLEFHGAPLTDAELSLFRRCGKLRTFLITGANVTDAGFQEFGAKPDLSHFELKNTRVTGTGLSFLEDSPKLGSLILMSGTITDDALRHLKGCKELQEIQFAGTKLTDIGIENLRGNSKLRVVGLESTRITDLAFLRGCSELEHLNLNNTGVRNDALSALADCKNLTYLHLRIEDLSDDGARGLSSLRLLKHLDLRNTKVTPAVIAILQAALPNCQVFWDKLPQP